ncbi:MAG TPA: phosphohydrolase, partial [Anaeromyxobacter sp.]|nr:phosphohydrolase [Anaeromyxobacter sp.]
DRPERPERPDRGGGRDHRGFGGFGDRKKGYQGPRLPGDKGPYGRPQGEKKALTHNPFAALAAKLEDAGGKPAEGEAKPEEAAAAAAPPDVATPTEPAPPAEAAPQAEAPAAESAAPAEPKPEGA